MAHARRVPVDGHLGGFRPRTLLAGRVQPPAFSGLPTRRSGCSSTLPQGLTACHEVKKEIEADILTDKQWDELLESFEVMKYDANKMSKERS